LKQLIQYDPQLKRILDMVLASSALILLSPLFCFLIVLIRLDSPGPAFFKQKRVGKDFRPFMLIKFRSMRHDSSVLEGQFEPGDGRRITRVGKVLRKTKLDELPEMFNVLIGDMSVVGPRPEVETYVEIFRDEYKRVLKVKPGLSDLASIKYRNEEEILAGRLDPEKFYMERILPDKLQLAIKYIEKESFKTDLSIIIETLKRILSRDHGHRKG
jgi:lipopolysaccharide/colanic/teichoic acid biosynthesis glycosyltransferase